MTRKHRILALLMAALVSVAMISSAAFIVMASHHVCIDGHCPVCYLIQVCESTFRQLITICCAAVIAMAGVRGFMRSAPVRAKACAHITLITLKVKLTN